MHRAVSTVSSLLALLIGAVPAFAGQRSLLVGTWTVDVARLTMPDPPIRVIIVLAEVGVDRYRMTVDIVDHDGATRHGETTFAPDGALFPAVGTADYDVVSMTMPSRRVWIMGGAFKGHPASTRVFSLSDDGKHMIETVVWHDPEGTPHTRVDFWNRASPRIH